MQWTHWLSIAVGVVLGLIVPGIKAYRAGTLNVFLAQKLEPLIDKAGKDAIKASAVENGLQDLLDKVVGQAGLKKGSAQAASAAADLHDPEG